MPRLFETPRRHGGQALIVKIEEDANAIIDSLIACKFAFFDATLEEFAKALSLFGSVVFI